MRFDRTKTVVLYSGGDVDSLTVSRKGATGITVSKYDEGRREAGIVQKISWSLHANIDNFNQQLSFYAIDKVDYIKGSAEQALSQAKSLT